MNVPAARRGFVALISAIILSSILLAATAAVSVRSLYARANALDDDYSARARQAARGCVEAARLMAAANPSFAGSASLSTGEGECSIGSVVRSFDAYAFTASAQEGNAAAAFSVLLDATDLSIRSITEALGVPP